MSAMAEKLLSIDIEAALAKVSVGRLRSNAQIPLALVRVAAACQPRQLRIDLKRSRLQIDFDGNPINAKVFELVYLLMDKQADDLDRQQALENLELLGMLDLLVAFAVENESLLLTAHSPVGLQLCSEGGKLSRNEYDGPISTIMVEGFPGSTSEQIAALKEHLAFAQYPVLLNAKRIDHGIKLDETIIQHCFEHEDATGIVGLPRFGLATQTQIVVNGVLSHDIWDSPPSGVVWSAIVCCQKDTQEKAQTIVSEEVSRLYRKAGKYYTQLSGQRRARVQELLFRLADFGASASAVDGVPMFRTIHGQLLTSKELKSKANQRVLRAIGPTARASRYELDDTVFVLNERQRGFVERHLGLLVREPRRRATPRGRVRSWLASAIDQMSNNCRKLGRTLMAVTEIKLEELSQDETAFRNQLQRVLDEGLIPNHTHYRVVFVRGKSFGWRWQASHKRGRGRLLLGRANKTVLSMIRAVDENPVNLYPVLMLLTDGQDGFGRYRRHAAKRLAGLNFNKEPITEC